MGFRIATVGSPATNGTALPAGEPGGAPGGFGAAYPPKV
jgi:hypothetical protein